MLTFNLLISNQFDGAAESIITKQDIFLASCAPATRSGLHALYSEPANFSAYVSDFQEPLFHRRCDGILDLAT